MTQCLLLLCIGHINGCASRDVRRFSVSIGFHSGSGKSAENYEACGECTNGNLEIKTSGCEPDAMFALFSHETMEHTFASVTVALKWLFAVCGQDATRTRWALLCTRHPTRLIRRCGTIGGMPICVVLCLSPSAAEARQNPAYGAAWS